mmetsp:Transcript_143527/g.264626  ORF Transcript_143527/g.264626 Transcript_143527/m.264626 type:complete len:86 (+) Transcript_143527:23-280(+)
MNISKTQIPGLRQGTTTQQAIEYTVNITHIKKSCTAELPETTTTKLRQSPWANNTSPHHHAVARNFTNINLHRFLKEASLICTRA